MFAIPVDILPVLRSPAVQVLTFYGGMPAASIEKNITARMERGVVQASGGERIESRSIVGVSIVRNYFGGHVDPSGALTESSSLAGWEYPTMPPGTLPPVVLPYDPTSSTPVCLMALDSATQNEATLFDTGRYEVRPMIMSQKGALAPLVYGGKVRAVMVYLDRQKLQARHLAPLDVLKAIDESNVFLPTGSAKFGETDYAIDSNSMFDLVEGMGEIPLRNEHGNAAYLRDVGTPKDANYIQTNVVRVNGRRQVYIPVFRQLGASTLQVVDTLKGAIETMKARLTRPGIDLQVVMDQSVYVRRSIESLVEEGILGAVLCSLVILLFLGQWRMTAIAIMTIPISVLAAVACLYASGNTINVMTLAGLALAIGPLVDSAIICLENTHRHLGLGATPEEAAYLGASEVALPELVSTLCTFLVLAPLAFMPGLGAFLFRPMAMAVAFAMIAAYVLSRTFVPSRSARWLRPHETCADSSETHRGWAARTFARWEALIDRGIAAYVRGLDVVLQNRLLTVGLGVRAPGVDPGLDRSQASPRVLSRGRRRRVRDLRPGTQRHPDRGHRKEDRAGRGVRPGDDRRGPPTDHLRDRRGCRPLGGLHPERRADGRGGQGPAQARSRTDGAAVGATASRGVRGRPPVRRPGVRLRRRRHDPRGDEPGKVVADQCPRHRQESREGPDDRRGDPPQKSSMSTEWSTPASFSGSTIRNTSSRSIVPRPPTSG